MEKQLNEILIRMYGETIIPKLEQIKEKMAIVVAAEVYGDVFKNKDLLEVKKVLDNYLDKVGISTFNKQT